MKVRTIDRGAAWIGVVSAAVAALSEILSGMAVWVTITTAVTMFLVTFFMAKYIFNRYVLFRIKPIYQILAGRNIKTDELAHDLRNRREDIVGQVEDELHSWVEKNSREITRLKENERYRKEFLGNISHEIKTPIFMIQGYILTLLDGALEDERINRKYLERSEKSIDRLINIVTDLEEISKLESGVLQLQWERFDIVALAHEIAESVEMEAAKKKISVWVGNSATPMQPIMVYADKKYIGQVLSNLIVNSIKYGVEGGRTKVSFIDMFDKVMVEVADNGIGISQDDIPRVFERFYRTDKSRSREQGGTGLGLSIVKHILEAHGEQITLRSTLGEGSTFAFSLNKHA